MGSRIALVVLLAALAAAGASCGKSGSSAQAFGREGSRICARYGRQAEAIKPPSGDTARYLSQTITVFERMNRAFRSLTPPASESKPYRQFLAALAQELRDFQQLQRFTAVNEPKALAALEHEKPRLHVPPRQALEHPTSATLAEVMSIPAVRKYQQGLDRLGRSSVQYYDRGVRLTKQLGFSGCLRAPR
jgi:hypothetical protein